MRKQPSALPEASSEQDRNCRNHQFQDRLGHDVTGDNDNEDALRDDA